MLKSVNFEVSQKVADEVEQLPGDSPAMEQLRRLCQVCAERGQDLPLATSFLMQMVEEIIPEGELNGWLMTGKIRVIHWFQRALRDDTKLFLRELLGVYSLLRER